MQLPSARLLLVFLVFGLLFAAATVHGGEFRRFPEPSAQPTSDESIEELKDLLRQAQALQKAQQKIQQAAHQKAAEAVGRRPEPGSPAKLAPDAKPEESAPGEATHDEAKKAVGTAGAEAPEKEQKEAEEKEEPKPLARPGCMYRGNELIWEKVAGSCRH